MYLRARPGPLFQIKPTETGSIFLHTGENEEAFQRQLKTISFFNEMRKFFPNFMCEGMQGGTEKSQQFSDDIDDIYWAEGYQNPLSHEVDEYGYIQTRGYPVKWLMEGEFAHRYGDAHNNYIDGNYWGYGSMNCAANVVDKPWAGEYDSFTDFDPEGVEAPLDLDEYLATVYENHGATPSLGSIGDWSAVQSYLQENFEGKSFYDILLTGVQNSDIATKHVTYGDHTLDIMNMDVGGYEVTHHGGFLYDGKEGSNGEGAYYLMLAMLEARRRINYAYSYVLGSAFSITDNTATVAHLNSVFTDTDKLGGLEDSTLRPLYSFIGATHPLRSFLTMFAGGYDKWTGKAWEPNSANTLDHFTAQDNYGFYNGKGHMLTALDIAASQRFRNWIYTNVTDYISHSGSSNDQALLDEWIGKIESPFLADEIQWNTAELTPGSAAAGAYLTYMSWDRWTLYLSDTSTGHSNSNLPAGLNPEGGDAWAGDFDYHKNYSIFQILNLDRQQQLGHKAVGGYADFTQANWVCNFVGRALDWKQGVMGETTACMVINNTQRRAHQKEIKEYDDYKREERDKKYNEAVLEQKHEKRIGELKAMRKPKKNAKAKRSDNKTKAKGNANEQSQKQEPNNHVQAKPKADKPVTMEKAMSALYLQMFNRMRANSQKRNKPAAEEGNKK